MTTASIRHAAPDDLEALAMLFDAYRRFYEQPADLPRARAFIGARMERGDSTILVAEDAAPGALAGFCQLYPTWCSVAAAPVLVLYDLFVAETARRAGTGRALMRAAQAHGRAAGVARLDLQTAHANTRAQALYESLGWRLDTVFRNYSYDLQGPAA
jgi:ribosomal protein S18 acetylase RimI-like enzyme